MVHRPEKYTYRVTWSEDDQEYVGLCAEFPSLSWLDKDQGAALSGVVRLVRDTLKDMGGAGEVPPEPLSLRKFKGQVAVRIPPELHRELHTQAAEAGVSLNRLISLKLARG